MGTWRCNQIQDSSGRYKMLIKEITIKGNIRVSVMSNLKHGA